MAGYEVESIEAQGDALRISGRVKWFDAGKGYGFIVPDDPSQTARKNVFLHVTSLRSSGREQALEGSLITCDVVRRPKGWQVAEVVELDEGPCPPPSERRQREAPVRGEGGFMAARPARRPVHATGPLERAKVKWFNRTKGYGFVV